MKQRILLCGAALFSACLISAAVQAIPLTWVGLRVWVYDYLTGEENLYRPKESDFKITPDPTGVAAGEFGIRWENAPATIPTTILPGQGITVTNVGGSKTGWEVSVDTAFVIHHVETPAGELVPGATCAVAAGSVAYRDNQDNSVTPFVCYGGSWKTLMGSTPAPLPPVVGSACPGGGVWSLKAGMYLCTPNGATKPTWAVVPMAQAGQ